MSRLFASVAIATIALSTSFADEIRPATDRPQPKSPAESAACVKMPADLRLELVAAEPLIREPAGFCFDESGRLFVCEIHGYNLDGYLDIVELNKTGELDRQVRRVRHATPESQAKAKLETCGTVRMLTDADGDGRMDSSTVWADRLPPCYGVIAAHGGVIVICAPDIVYLADRDGDGAAEIRETMFTGFARELIERGMNSPRWGVDGWIYVAAGGGGGQISGPKLEQPVSIGHTDFRFLPNGSAIEPVTGTESMFGLAMNDHGDRFHTICTQVSPLDYRYLARNPYVASPEGDVSLIDYRKVFPISRPDPWRLARGSDPAWVKFYGEAETSPNGFFTATSGQMIYRADYLPEAYRDNYFVCDPANNLVHRCLLERDGSTYRARRAPGEEQSEFLASGDQWFRPMSLGVGPEGAIYIVDMYREIIEDFSAIPRFLQQQYAESLIAGKDHGRIWRIVAAGSPPEPIAEATSKLRDGDAISLLGHPNHWLREQAQRLLPAGSYASHQDVEALEAVVAENKSDLAQIHALNALARMTLFSGTPFAAALDDEHWSVRVHALRVGEPFLGLPWLYDRVVKLAGDPDPRVRLQAALSLGELPGPRALEALGRLALDHGDERWMAAAIASSAAETAPQLLAMIAGAERNNASAQGSAGALAVMAPLAETVGARRDSESLAAVLELVAAAPSPQIRQVLLDGLERGLGRDPDAAGNASATLIGTLERLLTQDDAILSRRAMRIAGLLKVNESPAMQAAWREAHACALDDQRPTADRIASVSLLSLAPWPMQERLHLLLDARQPAELQLAAVAALGQVDAEDAADALTASWIHLSPRAQEAVVDAMFARQSRLPLLLAAVERGDVSAASLGALRREQLFEHSDAGLRERARKLLAQSDDERAAVIERFQPALAAERHPDRGAAVFKKTCARCHKLGETGHDVGPNLSAARTRPDATLLADILDPSGAIAQGYSVYNVAADDGRTFTGLLSSETATSISLRAASPAEAADPAPPIEQTILRKDIAEMRVSTKSLMPDGIEKELTLQDVADLLGYLRQSLGPLAPAGTVLFDDEQSFLDSLTEGEAIAALTTSDKIAGAAALHLAAGQRHSPRIPGWSFSIVEKPSIADRSFRYLRFRWKSAGAHGVLIELAADGGWPAADSPERRYYAGKNTSGWAATEVSPEAPADWTTVTVDLWKDFGPFTLTGIAPTALGGDALFDRMELLETP